MLAQARVLEVGEERDSAAQQAADAEAALEAARLESEAALAQRDAQLRQVMDAQQRLAQQLDAAEVAEQVCCSWSYLASSPTCRCYVGCCARHSLSTT